MADKCNYNVVTPQQPTDNNYNTNIMLLTNYLKGRSVIRKYLPDIKAGPTGLTMLNTLLLIKRYPRGSKYYLMRMSNSKSVDKCVPVLCDLGYITTCGRPRLIIPFQRYKVETGYVITSLGDKLIRDIINAL